MMEEFCLRLSVECCFLVGGCYCIHSYYSECLPEPMMGLLGPSGRMLDDWGVGACDRASGTLLLLALFVSVL